MRGRGHGHGKGKGRGRRGGAGKRRRMVGFLQPCILLQLKAGDSHGYELVQGLARFIDDADEYDPSMIYRLMKELEVNGYVSSYEGEVSRGPRRRMYRLTADGLVQLDSWVEDLRRSRREIDLLLDEYARVQLD